MKHRDKHKVVLLRSLRLENIRINSTYVCKSQYVKHGLGYLEYIINDRDMAIEPQLKNIVWNHIT